MTRRKPPEPLDLSRAKALPLAERANKCTLEDFREPAPEGASFEALLDSMPNFLGTQAQMLFFIALFYWVFTFTFSRLSLRYEKSLGLGER